MAPSTQAIPTPGSAAHGLPPFRLAVCAARADLSESLLHALHAVPFDGGSDAAQPGSDAPTFLLPLHPSRQCAAYVQASMPVPPAQDADTAEIDGASRMAVTSIEPASSRHPGAFLPLAGRIQAGIFLMQVRDGLSDATRASAYVLRHLGLRNAIFVVDLSHADPREAARFPDIAAAAKAFATSIEIPNSVCIPVRLADPGSDNVAKRSDAMAFHSGPTVLQHLRALVDAPEVPEIATRPMRLLVESVQTGVAGATRLSGPLLSGTVRAGDLVRIQPVGVTASVARIQITGEDPDRGPSGATASLELNGTCEVKPGDVISAASAPAQLADQFQATVVWTGTEPLLRGRTYQLRVAAQSISATIAPIRYKLDLHSLEHLAADRLQTGEIGVCELELARPMLFDPVAENPALGTFSLTDPITHATVGFGFLAFALRRAHNIHLHGLEVSRELRAAQKMQKPCVLWLTGLSGSGKSTIANVVDKKLYAIGKHAYVLDGDNVRHGLTKDLGFTAEDRVENIRRIAEVAKLMVDAGLIVLTAFISPFRSERHMARNLMSPDEFIEVYVDTPLALAEQRDPKGLYRKARRGEIKNFTGLDSPYEPPQNPEIHIQTTQHSPEEAADLIIEYLAHSSRW